MKKSEASAAQGGLSKSQQSVGEKLEAPVQLTPAQLEIVAAGFAAQLSRGSSAGEGTGTTATTGAHPTNPILKGL
jgi:hypothetical protein